jgi:hypothetical protein
VLTWFPDAHPELGVRTPAPCTKSDKKTVTEAPLPITASERGHRLFGLRPSSQRLKLGFETLCFDHEARFIFSRTELVSHTFSGVGGLKANQRDRIDCARTEALATPLLEIKKYFP